MGEIFEHEKNPKSPILTDQDIALLYEFYLNHIDQERYDQMSKEEKERLDELLLFACQMTQFIEEQGIEIQSMVVEAVEEFTTKGIQEWDLNKESLMDFINRKAFKKVLDKVIEEMSKKEAE